MNPSSRNGSTKVRPRPLISGRMMVCPRCKRFHDILQYVPMMQIEEFAHETNPIYKCPACRWMFSPAPHVVEDFTRTGVTETMKEKA